MPVAHLTSFKGQKVDICYDIHGIGCTPRTPSNLHTRTRQADNDRHRSPEERNAASSSKRGKEEAADTNSVGSPAKLTQVTSPFVDDSRASTSFGDPDDGDTYRDGSNHAECKEDQEAERVIFISGLGARGRTEFFQNVVDHLAELRDPQSRRRLVSVCTFDNRGIGGSTIFKHKRDYSTKLMAHDTLALIDHLRWGKVHLVGMSMGGMIATKFAAYWPERVLSVTVMSATKSGWHMVAGLARCPIVATLAGAGPLKSRIKNNLKFNFSDDFLRQRKDGRSFKEILVENTQVAIEAKDTKHFLAEGQPTAGREGHLIAVGLHRMTNSELERIRNARLPCQLIVGRFDRLARINHVISLATKLKAPLLILDAAHAGIVIESLSSVIASLESIIFGYGKSSKAQLASLSSEREAEILSQTSYAKEFASTFGPGRVSFRA